MAITHAVRAHLSTQVYGLPTLLLFKNGAPVEGSKREGAVSKPALLKYLEAQGFQPSPKA